MQYHEAWTLVSMQLSLTELILIQYQCNELEAKILDIDTAGRWHMYGDVKSFLT